MGYTALLPKDISKNSGSVGRVFAGKNHGKSHLRGSGNCPWTIAAGLIAVYYPVFFMVLERSL